MGPTGGSASPDSAIGHRPARTEYGIVVGIDGSGGSLHALRWAARRSAQFGSLQPVMTWQYPWWALSAPMAPPVDDFEQQARQVAEQALGAAHGVSPLPPIVCRGHPGQTLVDVGATANLIVVGTRGRSGLADALLGSVSSHVVANATVPVAVVPPEAPVEDTHGRVVVGVDGSVNALQALIWALKHAPSDATVEAVHSWMYPSAPIPGQAIIPYEVYEEKAQFLLEEAVRSAIEAVGPDRPPVETKLEYGDARANLRDLAQDSDLLVLGAKGRGGLTHLLLGSVTTALVHQPKTTTVVVPVVEH